MQNEIKNILSEIGEDVNRDGLLETPKRVEKAFLEIFSGYTDNPKQYMKVFEVATNDNLVILRNAEFYSMCEHHMLPFFGKISIGYIPDNKVIGVSKLARIVDVFAKRLQVQERLTEQVADFLMENLDAKGVMVVCEAEHLCMKMRGIKRQNSIMTTSAVKGVFKDNAILRSEFLNLIKEK